MASSFPLIVEKKAGPARLDENGLSAERCFSIMASSQVAAILILQGAAGIRRGTPYQERGGGIPVPACRCQQITCDERIACGSGGGLVFVNGAPSLGGVGLYDLTAYYSEMTRNGRAVPGGPTRWSRRPSMTSKRVDIDAEGKPIFTSSLESPDITALLVDEVLHGEWYLQIEDELAAAAMFRPFEGRINESDDERFKAKKGSLLMFPVMTEPHENGWMHMSCDIAFQPPKNIRGRDYEGWIDVFPDMGRRQVVDSSSTNIATRYAAMRDGEGNLVTDPLPLDGVGNSLSLAGLPGLSAGTTGVLDALTGLLGEVRMRSARNYKYADFLAIPFPKW